MSEVAAMRAFNRELAAVVGATVDVILTDGKKYQGTLRGIDQESLSIVLSEVVSEGDAGIPKMFIYGSSIMSFSVAEKEVSLEGLAKELQKSFPPGGVQYFPETSIVIVMNKMSSMLCAPIDCLRLKRRKYPLPHKQKALRFDNRRGEMSRKATPTGLEPVFSP